MGPLIGHGLFGDVIRAMNLSTGEIFAVKRLDLYINKTELNREAIKTLKAEIEVLKNHTHENIVGYVGSEIVSGRFCIYLECVSEGSVQSIYTQFGPLKESVIKRYTKHILKGLRYLHENGIIHHDLKGANVLVDSTGVVKLSDFGCSTLVSASLDKSEG